MKSDVSVIIPAYNAEKYLSRCLDSVVAQTMFDRMQVIIVDDGSVDGTGSIADKYAENHENVACIHQENGGESAARNTGLKNASGKYIGFVDADDWVEPDFFQKLYTAATRHNCDIACCGFTLERGANEMLKNNLTELESELDHKNGIIAFLKRDIDVHACTKLFRRDSLLSTRFNTDVHIGPDRWFSFDSILQANRIVLVGGSGYHYFMNPDSVMQSMSIERNFENLEFADYLMREIRAKEPDLSAYAESMAIIIKCRLLGDLALTKRTKDTEKIYWALKNNIRRFEMKKAYQHLSKKHFISLIVAKISPKLYGKLRSNEYLKYKA